MVTLFQIEEYCVVRAKDEPNSYHVVSRFRKNEFGKRLCLAPYLSFEEAHEFAKTLNKENTEG